MTRQVRKHPNCFDLQFLVLRLHSVHFDSTEDPNPQLIREYVSSTGSIIEKHVGCAANSVKNKLFTGLDSLTLQRRDHSAHEIVELVFPTAIHDSFHVLFIRTNVCYKSNHLN
jgi:hypothetical protein